MFLAVLTTVAFVGLLIAFGFLTDRLLGRHADQWARRITAAHEQDQPRSEQPVDNLAVSLQRLSDARTQHEVAAAFRELRDSASIQPQAWQSLNAETLLQALADSADSAVGPDSADSADERPANHLLADAFKKVLC